jgi:hypothetical protein
VYAELDIDRTRGSARGVPRACVRRFFMAGVVAILLPSVGCNSLVGNKAHQLTLSSAGGAGIGGRGGGGGTGDGGKLGAGSAGSQGTAGHGPGGSGAGAGGASVGTGGSSSAGAGGTAVGGSGGAPSTGTGGSSPGCQDGGKQCSGNGFQTCANGEWGVATPCGTRQTCAQSGTSAQCVCNSDPVCAAVGGTCLSDGMTLVSCAQDGDKCFYQMSSSTCTNGACSGSAGAAACCTNACSVGATQCAADGSFQRCTLNNGCTAWTTMACPTAPVSLVCERIAPAGCADPSWAEWPMPNCSIDVTNGAPNMESYTVNTDGTVSDNVTGLMWQQAVDTYTWSAAMAYCPTLTLGSHTDWRLPTKIELLSIVDYGVGDVDKTPTINATAFPSTPLANFWSATPVAGSPSSAWAVYFNPGDDHNGNRLASTATVATSSMNWVRCVR